MDVGKWPALIVGGGGKKRHRRTRHILRERVTRSFGAMVMCAGVLFTQGCAYNGHVPTQQIFLEERTLRFQLNRDGLSIDSVWIQIQCLQPVANPGPLPVGYDRCATFIVNGVSAPSYSTMLIFNSPDGHVVAMDSVDVSFSGPASHLCLALRVTFREVSHQFDVELFETPGDRYSLLSYCTVGTQPESAPNRYVFDQNRVRSLDKLGHALSNVINVRVTGTL